MRQWTYSSSGRLNSLKVGTIRIFVELHCSKTTDLMMSYLSWNEFQLTLNLFLIRVGINPILQPLNIKQIIISFLWLTLINSFPLEILITWEVFFLLINVFQYLFEMNEIIINKYFFYFLTIYLILNRVLSGGLWSASTFGGGFGSSLIPSKFLA